MWKQQIEQRLQSLKAEFAEGQKVLADLEAKQTSVRDTLLRISGAIQVLEEIVNNNIEDNAKVSEELEAIHNLHSP
jgi:chromosome segregation ATPase